MFFVFFYTSATALPLPSNGQSTLHLRTTRDRWGGVMAPKHTQAGRKTNICTARFPIKFGAITSQESPSRLHRSCRPGRTISIRLHAQSQLDSGKVEPKRNSEFFCSGPMYKLEEECAAGGRWWWDSTPWFLSFFSCLILDLIIHLNYTFSLLGPRASLSLVNRADAF